VSGQAGVQADRCTGSQVCGQTGVRADRSTGRQVYGQTGVRTDRGVGRHGAGRQRGKQAGGGQAGRQFKIIFHFSPSPNRKRMHSSPRTSGDESAGSSGKKVRQTGLSGRRKASRRIPFDEDKTSPVSGTLIRELADGEEIPAIHKGKKWIIFNRRGP
jgi:hypothetical protein